MKNNQQSREASRNGILATSKIYVGIVMNAAIAVFMFVKICNGGMHDEQWDYHYSMSSQWIVLLACVASAVCNFLMLKDRRWVWMLIVANLCFWYGAADLLLADAKTGIMHGEYAWIVVLLWLVPALSHIIVWRKK